MSVALTLFDLFDQDIGKKIHNLGSDSFVALLTNTLPAQTTAEAISDITQIANGNGYTTGGVSLTSVTWAQVSGGTWMFSAAAFSWTSSGSGMATFRYGVIANSTASKLVGWWDHGSGLSVAVGSQYQVTPDQTNGLFRVTRSP